MGGVVILVLRWGKVGNPRSEQGFFFPERVVSLSWMCRVSEAQREHTVCKAGDVEIPL